MRSLAADPDDFGETGDEVGPADTEGDIDRPRATTDENPGEQELDQPVEYGNKDGAGPGNRPDGRKTVWKGDKEFIWAPPGRPKDTKTEDLIEALCCMICSRPTEEHPRYVKFVQDRFENDPKYSFLKRGDASYVWFLWRLEENEVGRPMRRKKPDAAQSQKKDGSTGNETVKVTDKEKKREGKEGEGKGAEEQGKEKEVPRAKGGGRGRGRGMIRGKGKA